MTEKVPVIMEEKTTSEISHICCTCLKVIGKGEDISVWYEEGETLGSVTHRNCKFKADEHIITVWFTKPKSRLKRLKTWIKKRKR